jgi:hypothetical protein
MKYVDLRLRFLGHRKRRGEGDSYALAATGALRHGLLCRLHDLFLIVPMKQKPLAAP